MTVTWRYIASIALMGATGVLCFAVTEKPADWRMAKSPHFEVYSQSEPTIITETLRWFERLRQFFVTQTGLDSERLPSVRVIGFRSSAEYKLTQIRPTSDAYYLSAPGRDYIVMPKLGAGEFAVAAHEYTHVVIRALGVKLPPWLNEGLAEVFSTIRMGDGAGTFGGPFPAHEQLLKRHAWLPLNELMALPADSPLRDDREQSAIFYAESWALTDMLVLSPAYGPKFQALVSAALAGGSDADAFETVYAKTLVEVEKDLHNWLAKGTAASSTVTMPPEQSWHVDTSPVPERAANAVLAELLMDAGKLAEAEILFRDLASKSPETGDYAAALAVIAAKRGDASHGQELWRQAMAKGVSDAMLCYQFAVSQSKVSEAEDRRGALARAVELRPGFDDARYMLAMELQAAGDFDGTVAQLRAMKTVAPKRAFAYWATLSYGLDSIGEHDAAKQAALRAREVAVTPIQRAQAVRLAYQAETELAVQFTRDATGSAAVVTTRVPRGTMTHNPFVEPSDQMREAHGKLEEVRCQGQITGIVVQAGTETLEFAIPDPKHVQIVNGPSEFLCGAQASVPVVVSYALPTERDSAQRGVVRGIEFPSSAPAK